MSRNRENHQVTVEVILLRPGWAYRRAAAPLDGGGDPCDLARSLAMGPRLLHSTSWRHEPTAGVTLTYAAYPDPSPGEPAQPLDSLEIAFGSRPDAPRPADLDLDQVAAHALRHLAFLAATDPMIAADAELSALFSGIPAELAGRL